MKYLAEYSNWRYFCADLSAIGNDISTDGSKAIVRADFSHFAQLGDIIDESTMLDLEHSYNLI
jgi:hypothetical protein